MKNLIFVDIDGTLLLEDQTIPPSATQALLNAKTRGSVIVVATGRSKDAIPVDVSAIGFDGYITSGGAHVEIDNSVIRQVFFSMESLDQILSYLKIKGVGYYLETEKGVYASSNAQSVVRKNWRSTSNNDETTFEILMKLIQNTIDETTPMEKVMKICYISDSLTTSDIQIDLKDQFDTIPNTIYEFGEYSGEILLKNNDKSSAVKDVITYYGEMYQSYAYGNGLNDMTMFKTVDHAVAMSGGHPMLMKLADEITDTPENDGILKSFKINSII